MSQSAPWSVKGIDPEMRETAKVLAQRSGMTLGQWLQTMISEQKTVETPLFQDFDKTSLSPLATIARRLDKRYHDEVKPTRRRDDGAGAVSTAVLARHLRTSEARMASLIERVIQRQEESEAHLAALVDTLVDNFAGRPVDHGRRDPLENSKADGSVEDLERRIAAMALGLDAAPAQPEVEAPPETNALRFDALSEQIVVLTREIGELRRVNNAASGRPDDLAKLRADIAALGQHVTGLSTPAQLVQIDKKLDLLARQAQDPTILASLQRETADIRARLGDLVRQPDATERLERKLDALQLAVSDGQANIHSSISALGARLEALDAPGQDDAALAALERQIAAMAISVDALGQAKPDLSGLEPALRAALAQPALQGLPEDLLRHYRELRGFQESEGRQTHKALDALQALLHQVAGRLAAVEDFVRARGPGALLAGQVETGDAPALFGRERPDDIVWSQDLPRSLAGDNPHHPAPEETENGRPSQVSALARDGGSPSGTRSAFIAAARRASRAAAEADASFSDEKSRRDGGHEPFYGRHKRSILLGLAAVTMMMGALQGARAPVPPSNVRPVANTAPARPSPTRRPDAGGAAEKEPVAKIGPAALDSQDPLPRTLPRRASSNQAVSLFEEARSLDTPQASTFDLSRAAGLYRQAAQMGYAPALFLLGLAYDKGRGVGHDVMLAGLWYQRAAEQGSLKAMYNLAVLYACGAVMGVPDYKQAARWFHLAAEQGHVASQYNFALLAAQGLGTPRDLVTARRFLSQAAAEGDADAFTRLEEIDSWERGHPIRS
jgi:Sel1 repeat